MLRYSNCRYFYNKCLDKPNLDRKYCVRITLQGLKKKLGMVSLTLTFLHEGNCVDLYKLKN